MRNLCKDCTAQSLCCYYSVSIGKYIIRLDNHPCKYLNSDNKCIIYKKRFKINSNGCKSIKYAIKKKTLPKECLYVKDNEEYQNARTVTSINDVIEQLTKDEKSDYNFMNDSLHIYIGKY